MNINMDIQSIHVKMMKHFSWLYFTLVNQYFFTQNYIRNNAIKKVNKNMKCDTNNITKCNYCDYVIEILNNDDMKMDDNECEILLNSFNHIRIKQKLFDKQYNSDYVKYFNDKIEVCN